MMCDFLREEVLEANLELVRRGLVLYTFGNASGIDRDRGLVAIKPSGVPYEKMKSSDITLVDLDGKTVEGTLRPSSDLATHLISPCVPLRFRLRRREGEVAVEIFERREAGVVWKCAFA